MATSGSLSKETVKSRLQSGEYVLKSKTNVRNIETWSNFKIVCNAKTRAYVDFVTCVKCNILYHMKEGASTSTLTKHASKCNGSSQMGPYESATTFVPPTPNQRPQTNRFQRPLASPSPSTMPSLSPSPTESPTPSPTPFAAPPSPLLAPPSPLLAPSPTAQGPFSPSPVSSFSDSEGTGTGTPHSKKRRPRKGVVTDITSGEKQEIVDLCVKFSAIDLRPFNAVKGEGFKLLAQGLIDVGAEHGKIDVEKVLPHPSTVSKKTSAVANRVKQEFLPQVKRALKDGRCAFQTDLWTDKFTKRAYLTLDCQYSTLDFDLKTLTLFTVEFPEKKKTGENILKVLVSELKSMGFSESDIKKATFNTDQGSNIMTALKEHHRLDCTAHVLATVIRNIFDFHKKKQKSFLYSNARECCDCILACKNVVTYIKRSGKNVKLARTVKMMAETRWNTLVLMLESVIASMLDIIDLLAENGEGSKLQGWDAEIATQLAKVLTPFKNVSVELQAKKSPTLHLVLIRRDELLKHCDIDYGNDHTEIVTIKKKAAKLIEEKFVLDDVHYAAAFLCPNTRNLKLLDNEERARARRVVKAMLEKNAQGNQPPTPRATESEASVDGGQPADAAVMPPPPKKSRFGNWAEDGEDDDNAESTAEIEIDFYLKVGKPESDDPEKALVWWRNKTSMFARLAVLARQVLSIPATSASSERTFSRAGLVVTEKRTNLCPKRVNDLLVIHNYYLAGIDTAHEQGMFIDHIDDDEGEGSGDDFVGVASDTDGRVLLTDEDEESDQVDTDSD